MNQAQSTLDYRVALAQLEHALGRPLPVERKPLEQVTGPTIETQVGLTNTIQGTVR
jgi:hypothetical protein